VAQRDSSATFKPRDSAIILLDQKLLKKLSITVTSLAFGNIVLLIAWSFILGEPQLYTLEDPKRLLIFASHQDDAVIQAGGLAIRNASLGGEIKIVYLTVPEDGTEKRVRWEEAKDAWSLLGEGKVELEAMGYAERAAWSEVEINEAARRLVTMIREWSPDLIVLPLREMGHVDHDSANVIGWAAVAASGKLMAETKILEAAEYNPFFLAKEHPEKVLNFLRRLMPFMSYQERTYGLKHSTRMDLNLSDDELAIKIDMLGAFMSQLDVIPVTQFGYADVFDSSDSQPRHVIKVGSKYLSIWTLFTISCLAAMLFCWGLAISMAFSRRSALVVGWGLGLAGLIALATSPRWAQEELLLVWPVVIGLILGAMFRKFVNLKVDEAA
jgi:LmbE family N-acetylglucosaminyl deacetylase